ALFLSEARAIAALNHPNIVQVFDVGEIQSVQGVIPYMAMERLTGESLDRLLNRKFDFSPSQIIKIAYKVAIALQHAHQACIIHRDIKPANVFLQLPGGNVKVLDFGLARTLRAAQMRVPANTMNDDSLGKGVSDAVLVGTPGYVSPEQAQDRPVDGRSDLFSLGILMYRMASGRLPFDGDTTAEQLVAMMVGTPAPLNDSCTGFDRAFYQLVDACLQKQKRNRPPSAAAVADSLREILSSMKDGEWDHLHDALKDDANVVAQTTGSASIPHPAIPIPAINVRPRRIGTTRRGAGHDNRLWLLPLTIAIGIVACVATYFAWPATDSLDPLATAPRRVRNQIARPRFASEIPDYDSADTPFFHNLEDESPDEIVSNRPRQNVPDALQSLKLFRIPGGISADTYVEEFSDRDYSTENHLIISVKKRSTGTPRRKTYLRFDLRDAGFQMQDIEDVFLLLTMNTRGIDADAVYRFSVSLLRDDSPAAEWQASGPNRIRYANTPEQVRSIDLLPC
ncbi:MAG: serine/threonine-protein kinase, partial [Planctomycetota bacterium]